MHMSHIRTSGTSSEMILRHIVKQMTDLPLKFNVSKLVGKPDIVIPRLKIAIFMDGCFWHGCPDHGKIPKSHKNYWRSKIVGNMVRDEEVSVALEEDGWTVWRVWEHDLKTENIQNTRRRLKRRLAKILNS